MSAIIENVSLPYFLPNSVVKLKYGSAAGIVIPITKKRIYKLPGTSRMSCSDESFRKPPDRQTVSESERLTAEITGASQIIINGAPVIVASGTPLEEREVLVQGNSASLTTAVIKTGIENAAAIANRFSYLPAADTPLPAIITRGCPVPEPIVAPSITNFTIDIIDGVIQLNWINTHSKSLTVVYYRSDNAQLTNPTEIGRINLENTNSSSLNVNGLGYYFYAKVITIDNESFYSDSHFYTSNPVIHSPTITVNPDGITVSFTSSPPTLAKITVYFKASSSDVYQQLIGPIITKQSILFPFEPSYTKFLENGSYYVSIDPQYGGSQVESTAIQYNKGAVLLNPTCMVNPENVIVQWEPLFNFRSKVVLKYLDPKTATERIIDIIENAANEAIFDLFAETGTYNIQGLYTVIITPEGFKPITLDTVFYEYPVLSDLDIVFNQSTLVTTWFTSKLYNNIGAYLTFRSYLNSNTVSDTETIVAQHDDCTNLSSPWIINYIPNLGQYKLYLLPKPASDATTSEWINYNPITFISHTISGSEEEKEYAVNWMMYYTPSTEVTIYGNNADNTSTGRLFKKYENIDENILETIISKAYYYVHIEQENNNSIIHTPDTRYHDVGEIMVNDIIFIATKTSLSISWIPSRGGTTTVTFFKVNGNELITTISTTNTTVTFTGVFEPGSYYAVLQPRYGIQYLSEISVINEAQITNGPTILSINEAGRFATVSYTSDIASRFTMIVNRSDFADKAGIVTFSSYTFDGTVPAQEVYYPLPNDAPPRTGYYWALLSAGNSSNYISSSVFAYVRSGNIVNSQILQIQNNKFYIAWSGTQYEPVEIKVFRNDTNSNTGGILMGIGFTNNKVININPLSVLLQGFYYAELSFSLGGRIIKTNTVYYRSHEILNQSQITSRAFTAFFSTVLLNNYVNFYRANSGGADLLLNTQRVAQEVVRIPKYKAQYNFAQTREGVPITGTYYFIVTQTTGGAYTRSPSYFYEQPSTIIFNQLSITSNIVQVDWVTTLVLPITINLYYLSTATNENEKVLINSFVVNNSPTYVNNSVSYDFMGQNNIFPPVGYYFANITPVEDITTKTSIYQNVAASIIGNPGLENGLSSLTVSWSLTKPSDVDVLIKYNTIGDSNSATQIYSVTTRFSFVTFSTSLESGYYWSYVTPVGGTQVASEFIDYIKPNNYSNLNLRLNRSTINFTFANQFDEDVTVNLFGNTFGRVNPTLLSTTLTREKTLRYDFPTMLTYNSYFAQLARIRNSFIFSSATVSNNAIIPQPLVIQPGPTFKISWETALQGFSEVDIYREGESTLQPVKINAGPTTIEYSTATYTANQDITSILPTDNYFAVISHPLNFTAKTPSTFYRAEDLISSLQITRTFSTIYTSWFRPFNYLTKISFYKSVTEDRSTNILLKTATTPIASFAYEYYNETSLFLEPAYYFAKLEVINPNDNNHPYASTFTSNISVPIAFLLGIPDLQVGNTGITLSWLATTNSVFSYKIYRTNDVRMSGRRTPIATVRATSCNSVTIVNNNLIGGYYRAKVTPIYSIPGLSKTIRYFQQNQYEDLNLVTVGNLIRFSWKATFAEIGRIRFFSNAFPTLDTATFLGSTITTFSTASFTMINPFDSGYYFATLVGSRNNILVEAPTIQDSQIIINNFTVSVSTVGISWITSLSGQNNISLFRRNLNNTGTAITISTSPLISGTNFTFSLNPTVKNMLSTGTYFAIISNVNRARRLSPSIAYTTPIILSNITFSVNAVSTLIGWEKAFSYQTAVNVYRGTYATIGPERDTLMNTFSEVTGTDISIYQSTLAGYYYYASLTPSTGSAFYSEVIQLPPASFINTPAITFNSLGLRIAWNTDKFTESRVSLYFGEVSTSMSTNREFNTTASQIVLPPNLLSSGIYSALVTPYLGNTISTSLFELNRVNNYSNLQLTGNTNKLRLSWNSDFDETVTLRFFSDTGMSLETATLIGTVDTFSKPYELNLPNPLEPSFYWASITRPRNLNTIFAPMLAYGGINTITIEQFTVNDSGLSVRWNTAMSGLSFVNFYRLNNTGNAILINPENSIVGFRFAPTDSPYKIPQTLSTIVSTVRLFAIVRNTNTGITASTAIVTYNAPPIVHNQRTVVEDNSITAKWSRIFEFSTSVAFFRSVDSVPSFVNDIYLGAVSTGLSEATLAVTTLAGSYYFAGIRPYGLSTVVTPVAQKLGAQVLGKPVITVNNSQINASWTTTAITDVNVLIYYKEQPNALAVNFVSTATIIGNSWNISPISPSTGIYYVTVQAPGGNLSESDSYKYVRANTYSQITISTTINSLTAYWTAEELENVDVSFFRNSNADGYDVTFIAARAIATSTVTINITPTISNGYFYAQVTRPFAVNSFISPLQSPINLDITNFNVSLAQIQGSFTNPYTSANVQITRKININDIPIVLSNFNTNSNFSYAPPLLANNYTTTGIYTMQVTNYYGSTSTRTVNYVAPDLVTNPSWSVSISSMSLRWDRPFNYATTIALYRITPSGTSNLFIPSSIITTSTYLLAAGAETYFPPGSYYIIYTINNTTNAYQTENILIPTAQFVGIPSLTVGASNIIGSWDTDTFATYDYSLRRTESDGTAIASLINGTILLSTINYSAQSAIDTGYYRLSVRILINDGATIHTAYTNSAIVGYVKPNTYTNLLLTKNDNQLVATWSANLVEPVTLKYYTTTNSFAEGVLLLSRNLTNAITDTYSFTNTIPAGKYFFSITRPQDILTISSQIITVEDPTPFAITNFVVNPSTLVVNWTQPTTTTSHVTFLRKLNNETTPTLFSGSQTFTGTSNARWNFVVSLTNYLSTATYSAVVSNALLANSVTSTFNYTEVKPIYDVDFVVNGQTGTTLVTWKRIMNFTDFFFVNINRDAVVDPPVSSQNFQTFQNDTNALSKEVPTWALTINSNYDGFWYATVISINGTDSVFRSASKLITTANNYTNLYIGGFTSNSGTVSFTRPYSELVTIDVFQKVGSGTSTISQITTFTTNSNNTAFNYSFTPSNFYYFRVKRPNAATFTSEPIRHGGFTAGTFVANISSLNISRVASLAGCNYQCVFSDSTDYPLPDILRTSGNSYSIVREPVRLTNRQFFMNGLYYATLTNVDTSFSLKVSVNLNVPYINTVYAAYEFSPDRGLVASYTSEFNPFVNLTITRAAPDNPVIFSGQINSNTKRHVQTSDIFPGQTYTCTFRDFYNSVVRTATAYIMQL